jgi:hypothetical protein
MAATGTNKKLTKANLLSGYSELGTSVDDTEMSSEDFGGFTCTGAEDGCTIDSDGTWTIHNSYPSACTAGQYVTAVGDTLTCGTPAGSGDVLDVGPSCPSGNCFMDGQATTGTTLFIWEGTTPDANEISFVMPTADPVADIVYTFPPATGTIARTSDNVATATALAANGANCIDGQAALGVDASGAGECVSLGASALAAEDFGSFTCTGGAGGCSLDAISAPAGSTWNIVDSVTALSVYTGTTSLEETTSATDSGAYIIGVYPEFTNSASSNVQDVLDDIDAAMVSIGSSIGGLILGDSSPDSAGEIGYDGELKFYNTALRTVLHNGSNAIDPDALAGDTVDDDKIDSAILDADLSTLAALTLGAEGLALLEIDTAANVKTELGYITDVVDDTSPTLGSDLDMGAYGAYGAFTTLTVNSATPSVLVGVNFLTANTLATTITDFTGTTTGMPFRVIINDSLTTIKFTEAGLRGHGEADLATPPVGTILSCIDNGTTIDCDVSQWTSMSLATWFHPMGTTPAQTAEGSDYFDTVKHVNTIGNGATRVVQKNSGITSDTAATVALTSADCQGQWRVNDDDDVIDYTLPGAEAGLECCFISMFARVVTVDPVDGTDTIYLNGDTVGAGDAIDSPGTTGDHICVLGLDATRWVTMNMYGTWVDGGAD